MATNKGSVGHRNIYKSGDQRTYPDNVINERERYKEGQPNSHLLRDTKKDNTMKNRLDRQQKRYQEPDEKELDVQRMQKDPTLPAQAHGNEPSKGAKIDKQLKEEEEEILKKKGSVGPRK